jgi:hypothetical protein
VLLKELTPHAAAQLSGLLDEALDLPLDRRPDWLADLRARDAVSHQLIADLLMNLGTFLQSTPRNQEGLLLLGQAVEKIMRTTASAGTVYASRSARSRSERRTTIRAAPGWPKRRLRSPTA